MSYTLTVILLISMKLCQFIKPQPSVKDSNMRELRGHIVMDERETSKSILLSVVEEVFTSFTKSTSKSKSLPFKTLSKGMWSKYYQQHMFKVSKVKDERKIVFCTNFNYFISRKHFPCNRVFVFFIVYLA